MTRRHIAQLTLTSAALFAVVMPAPEELMDPVLRQLDPLLDDEALVDRVLEVQRRRRPQSARRGRPGTPATVVLRLLVLKHLRGWSYDQLEWEVTGNLVYRRFCRIDAGKVPDAKTILRQGQLLDGPVLRELFDRITHLAVERKVTVGRRMRVDTTVVEAPIRYPTDSGLCEDVVRVMRRYMGRLVAPGVRLSFPLRHVGRSVSRRMRGPSRSRRPIRGASRRVPCRLRPQSKEGVTTHANASRLRAGCAGGARWLQQQRGGRRSQWWKRQDLAHEGADRRRLQAL